MTSMALHGISKDKSGFQIQYRWEALATIVPIEFASKTATEFKIAAETIRSSKFDSRSKPNVIVVGHAESIDVPTAACVFHVNISPPVGLRSLPQSVGNFRIGKHHFHDPIVVRSPNNSHRRQHFDSGTSIVNHSRLKLHLRRWIEHTDKPTLISKRIGRHVLKIGKDSHSSPSDESEGLVKSRLHTKIEKCSKTVGRHIRRTGRPIPPHEIAAGGDIKESRLSVVGNKSARKC